MLKSRVRLNVTRVLGVLFFFTLCVSISHWASHPLFEKSLFFVGLTLASLGAFGRVWALSHIAGNKSEQLITTGPYSLCRNPLYFSSLLLALGIGFCTETFTAAILLGILVTFVSLSGVRREESRLLKWFGADYEAYCARVPRFVPRSLRGYSEPETITISSRFMRRGVFEIAPLFTLIGSFELLEALHQTHVLPVWFVIY